MERRVGHLDPVTYIDVLLELLLGAFAASCFLLGLAVFWYAAWVELASSLRQNRGESRCLKPHVLGNRPDP